MELKIVSASRSEAELIATIHKKSFSQQHFTSSFSIGLLTRYYDFFIANNSKCFLFYSGQEIVGFVVSGFNTKVALKKFKQRYFLSILYYLLLNPSHLWKKFNMPKLGKTGFQSLAEFRLLSIAVVPSFIGKGISRHILLNFEQNLKSDGIDLYGLSVRKANNRAVRFYINQGFEEEYRGETNIYFTKSLSSSFLDKDVEFPINRTGNN